MTNLMQHESLVEFKHESLVEFKHELLFEFKIHKIKK